MKNAESSPPTPEPVDTMLAFFDVLGFSNRVATTSLESIYADYNTLTDYLRELWGTVIFTAVPDGRGGAVPVAGSLVIEHAYFSDTILLWSRYDPLRAPAFHSICARFICQSMRMRIPMRGAIAMGPAIMDKANQVFLGYPIVEGANAEKHQDWIGASFGPSLNQEKYRHLGPITELHAVIPYRAQIKAGRDEFVQGLALDWPRTWRDNYDEDIRSIIAELNTEPKAANKYRTTLDFIDYSEANPDWATKAYAQQLAEKSE
jgi:hypothetical protein